MQPDNTKDNDSKVNAKRIMFLFVFESLCTGYKQATRDQGPFGFRR
jgi:hypothetical protein